MADDFYADPANQEPTPKRAVRRSTPTPAKKTEYVPVRFPTADIAAARRLARVDGMSISAWLRALVRREIARRERSRTTTTTDFSQVTVTMASPSSTTVGAHAVVEELRRG